MIATLLRLGMLGAITAWLADRWLAGRAAAAGRREPRPIEALMVVDAPVESVWDALADVPSQPRWMTDMKAVRILTPGPVGAGTRSEGTIRILGITVTDPVEITAFEPPDRFAVRHEGLFDGHGDITLQSGADGTTTIVRWSETLVPPVLPWLWSELNRPVFRHVFQTDLENLRDLVESGRAAQPMR